MPDDLLSTIRAEIDARMGQLWPALEEYEGLLAAADALGVRRGRPPGSGGGRRRASRAATGRAARGAAAKAILAALEHGSHTVRELVVVTAMADPNIRANIRRMLAEGIVVKVSRDGKVAYALPAG